MTTTLRPTGPEGRTADGGRSRSYDVCVNSRPVGSVRLATDPARGPAVGRIVSLRIEPAARRRGRATVAALAAEEVLRAWRCERIEVSVPGGAEWVLRLAAALGYTEYCRRMVKEVTEEPPALPGGTADRAMDAAEFAAWLPAVRAASVRVWTQRGLSPSRAGEQSDTEQRRLLPDGAATAHTALRVLTRDGTPVGTLWAALRGAGPDRPHPWVLTVEVAAAHRGQGHGRSLMLVAERECLAAGGRRLGLQVSGGNTPARKLYASLGYRTTAHQFCKVLL